jgi:hypothetical protein
MNDLPVGDKKKDVENYFNYLEELISTKDPDEFVRERFPPDDPAIGGERVYKYHSPAYFKQQASECQVQDNGPGMGSTQVPQTVVPPTEGPPTEVSHLEHVQERAGGCSPNSQGCDGGRSVCPDIQGQLDSGYPCGIPN